MPQRAEVLGGAGAKESGRRRKKVVGAVAGALGVDLPVRVVVVEIEKREESNQGFFFQIDELFAGLERHDEDASPFIGTAREGLRRTQFLAQLPPNPITNGVDTLRPAGDLSEIGLLQGPSGIVDWVIGELVKNKFISKKDSTILLKTLGEEKSIETSFAGVSLGIRKFPSSDKSSRMGLTLFLDEGAIKMFKDSPALPALPPLNK